MAIDGMQVGEVLELLGARLFLTGESEPNIAALCEGLLPAPDGVQDRQVYVEANILATLDRLGMPELAVNPARRNTRPGVCAVCGGAVEPGAGRFYWREGAKRETFSGATYYEGGEDLVCDGCTATKETTNG